MSSVNPRAAQRAAMPPIAEDCPRCVALQERVRELEQTISRERKSSEETIEQLEAINFRLKLLRHVEMRTENARILDERVHAFCILTLLTMATVVYFVVNRESYATPK